VTLEIVSANKSHGGVQGVYRHLSRETKTPMIFSVFVPSHASERRKLPVIWYLSGLTCTHANVTEKGEYRRICAELGMVLIATDTSPRGEGVPGDPQGLYDFGLGAGFYVDATEAPFSTNYRMHSYVAHELPELVAANFPVDLDRQAIFGHSMGGHGALTIALKQPGRFRSVSAFAPIVAPSQVPWGRKAFGAYLGSDTARWSDYDACALIERGHRVPDILVDQGDADNFLEEQLKPELLRSVCDRVGQKLTLRMQPGYDHSYYFISSFMDDHLRWHATHMA